MPAVKPLLIAEELPLQQWLDLVTRPERERAVRVIDYQFPTDQHRDQFLAAAVTYSEATVLVATGGFTKVARQEASTTHRIELIDFRELNLLLNAHVGPAWPDHMFYEIRRTQRALASTAPASGA